MTTERLREHQSFLDAKVRLAPGSGFEVDPDEVNPELKPFTRDIVRWALAGGRRGIFGSFGLHKTCTQLEIMRLIGVHRPCLRLIGLPLGVRQEFTRDAQRYFRGEHAVRLKFIRSASEIEDERTIYLTNHESIRERVLDVGLFGATSIDEASMLRSFGSKTFSELLFGAAQRAPIRFVATATPSPNEYLELLAYAQYLGVMDIGEAKTRFFRRNSERADDLTIHPHKELEFWMWLASWGLFITRPSDLGYSDEGYELPTLDLRWHEVPTDHSDAGADRRGQGSLLKSTKLDVQAASREKRRSLPARLAKLMEIRQEDPGAHRILWHTLEEERRALEREIPGLVSVYGAQGLEFRESAIVGFSEGCVRELAAKPVMLGSGCNFQRHCNWAVFLGIDSKFNDFIQAIHRLRRFGQTHPVRIDVIYTEAEREVRARLERRWRQHEHQVEQMTSIIREHGLSRVAMASALTRSMGVERLEAAGEGWAAVRNDSILETAAMEEGSVDLVVTSIPFSGQYEYTPSYRDFGHTDSDEHFFEQMSFLTPELLRVLKPGRVCAVHVKDRVMPGAMSGTRYQEISPFHAYCLLHFKSHGFSYMGMVTVTTDVVRENNQTYRLSYGEMLKDGSRMSFGLPEYVLLFRKRPTDPSSGYADERVIKAAEEYSLARWQVDAHAFWRSSGNRLIGPEDFVGLTTKQVYRLFRALSYTSVYDFERHVAIGESLARSGKLRKDFMLLPPASWHPDVWSDVVRARTLNSRQAQRRREKHLCPLQFDIVDRLITRFSNPGELVFDPFAGVFTVPYCAVRLGRRGLGCELNEAYWADGVHYLRAAEAEAPAPTLFDLLEISEAAGDEDVPEQAEVPA